MLMPFESGNLVSELVSQGNMPTIPDQYLVQRLLPLHVEWQLAPDPSYVPMHPSRSPCFSRSTSCGRGRGCESVRVCAPGARGLLTNAYSHLLLKKTSIYKAAPSPCPSSCPSPSLARAPFPSPFPCLFLSCLSCHHLPARRFWMPLPRVGSSRT